MPRFDLTINEDRAIEQGDTLNWLVFYHPSDLSGYTPYGQIKTTFNDKEGILLASFIFPAINYVSVTLPGMTNAANYSIVKPTLTDELTSGLILPNTRSLTSRIREGYNAWVYDIFIENPIGEVFKLVWGYVDVVPRVSTN